MVTFHCSLELLYTSLTLSLAVENIIRLESVVCTLISSINAKIGQQLPNCGEICQLFQAMTLLVNKNLCHPYLPYHKPNSYMSHQLWRMHIQYTFFILAGDQNSALQTVIAYTQ